MRNLAINYRYLVLLSALFVFVPNGVWSGEVAGMSSGSIKLSAKRQCDISRLEAQFSELEAQLSGGRKFRLSCGNFVENFCPITRIKPYRPIRGNRNQTVSAERFMMLLGFALANVKGRGIAYSQ